MLRMIIADNERIIRETICRLIDWESLDIKIVGLCKNGLEAYDTIIDEYPDIVMTDIKMPGLSGLELIEKLTQTHERIHFIILSGYGEFEYAKKAMRYGTKHFLLKPCNEQQIIAAVEDVKKELLKNTPEDIPASFEKSLFRSLITEGISAGESQTALSDSYINYLDFRNVPYTLHYLYFLVEENLSECTSRIDKYLKQADNTVLYHMFYVKNTLLLLIKEQGQIPVSLTGLLENLIFDSESIQISHQQDFYPDLESLYLILIQKLRRYDKIYYLDGIRQIPIYNYNSCLTLALDLCHRYWEEGLDNHTLRNLLEDVFASIQELDFLVYLLTNILVRQGQHLSGLDSVSVTEFLRQMNETETVPEITSLFFDRFDTFFPETSGVTYKPFIEKLITYIEEHLSDPNLSLKWLSTNYLYMSVDYVSKQFSLQTGEKFSNYLNRLRITKAKSLLIGCDTENIYTIAEQVGCGNNPQYFSQLFKKYTGMTPTEYMKKMSGK